MKNHFLVRRKNNCFIFAAYGLTMNIKCAEFTPIKRWWLNSDGQLHLGDHRRFVKYDDYCLETVYYEQDNYIDIEMYLCKDIDSPRWVNKFLFVFFYFVQQFIYSNIINCKNNLGFRISTK